MKIRLFYEKNLPFVAEPEMEDSDSADEKVEHYLESPEKEPQKSPEKEQPQKEEDKTCEIAASQQEENQESHAATCNLHLQNNKEIDNNIMEEKLIEVKNCILAQCDSFRQFRYS